jgi:hypothetical protein
MDASDSSDDNDSEIDAAEGLLMVASDASDDDAIDDDSDNSDSNDSDNDEFGNDSGGEDGAMARMILADEEVNTVHIIYISYTTCYAMYTIQYTSSMHY